MRKNIVIIVLIMLAGALLGILSYFLIVANLSNIIKFLGSVFATITALVTVHLAGLAPKLKKLVTDLNDNKSKISELEEERKKIVAGVEEGRKREAIELERQINKLEKECRNILKDKFRDPESSIAGYTAKVGIDYIEQHFSKDPPLPVGRGLRDPEYLIRRDQRQTEYTVKSQAVVLNKSTRTALIIGGQGTGKTFYLKRLEWEALFQDEGINAFPGVKYPIYINFQQFARSPFLRKLITRQKRNGELLAHQRGDKSPLLQYVIYQWHRHPGHDFQQYSKAALTRFLDKKLKSGEAIFLLDGIDKIGIKDLRERNLFNALLRNIEGLKTDYTLAPIIITSRPGIIGDPSQLNDSQVSQLNGFIVICIQNFRLVDIHAFINKSTVGNLEIPEKDVLWKLIERNMRLQAMAAKPLDLACIHKMYMDSIKPFSTGKFLQDRFKLYQASINNLLIHSQEFYSENIFTTLSRSFKERIFRRNLFKADYLQNLLARVAWDMHKDRKYAFSEDEWQKRIAMHLTIKSNKNANTEEFVNTNAAIDPRKRTDSKKILDQILKPQGLLRKGLMETQNSFKGGLDGKPVYYFSNIAFQEYLAVWFALNIEDQSSKQVLKNNADKSWWEEIFLLFLSQLSAGPAIDCLKSKFRLEAPFIAKDENYWNESILLARCFGVVKEIDSQPNDLGDIREDIILRLYDIIFQAPSLFWRKRACLALAEMNEHELLYQKWENRSRKHQNTSMNNWTLRKEEHFSPVLLSLLTTLPEVVKKIDANNPTKAQIEWQFRRLLQDLDTLSDEEFKKVFRDEFEYRGMEFRLTVYARLHMLAAVYVRALYHDSLVATLSSNFIEMLTDNRIDDIVRAGIAHIVGLLCNEQTMRRLIDILDWGISEYLRWNIVGAMGIVHSRLGVCDELYLPDRFQEMIKDENVSDLQALHMAILLVSKMYYYPDHVETQSPMKFKFYGRPFSRGDFENKGIDMLKDAPEIILKGYSNSVDKLIDELKIYLRDNDFPYLLDLLGHLAESPSLLNIFEGRKLDENLEDKKNYTKWQIEWNQSICG